MYGFATPETVAIPVAAPPPVISTISTSQSVSDAPADQLKSAEVVVIFVAVNAEGSGHAIVVENANGPTHAEVPFTPQIACT